MAPRQTWEYKIIYTDNIATKGLDQLGAEGWELAATAPTVTNNNTFIFKRPI